MTVLQLFCRGASQTLVSCKSSSHACPTGFSQRNLFRLLTAVKEDSRCLSSWFSSSPRFSTSSACRHPEDVSTGVGAGTSGFSDHSLSAEQLEFRSMAQRFAANELLPNAAKWDEEKHFPVDVLKMMAELGFSGLFCREDVGGSALSRADGAVVFEALAYGDISTTAYLTIHNMCCSIIDRFGSEEQRQRWLPSLISMDRLSSYCLTEPDSGSDAASLQTSATKNGDGEYVLQGAKAFISGGGVSDVYLVMARTSGAGPSGISCFVVEKGMKGLSFGKQENKLGWNAQPTAAVMLDGVCVPATNMIGGIGQGFHIAMAALDGGRINIASCSIGGAQFCVDQAHAYTLQRKQFGKRIVDFQHTQFKLADMATQVEAGRLHVRNAATALDAHSPFATVAAAMAKRHATDASYSVANDALQMFGGYGYLKDYPVRCL
eukprot:TRINITY_DN13131_c0_g1_i3.p1 TRINITY_DN13131_c0_g1~~TRINITY_DN13131_c0_g1_i3.p1  ORF type:complete len:434 (-),score=97.32 TRINITY_DN13131_c0_g1_i3:392-1693(-)